MISRITTVAFQGIKAIPIDIQVHISNGLPAFSIVGLADKTVAESRERIRSAISSMGLALPAKRITVNLSPADLQKEGSHFDLPITLAILAGMSVLSQETLEEYVAVGELSLAGDILPVAGVLSASVYGNEVGKKIICPKENASEAAWGNQIGVLGPTSLLQIVHAFEKKIVLDSPTPKVERFSEKQADLKVVKGQEMARRALEIAAAGGHNMLMIGPPGSGKSLLASCLPSILPDLSPMEALEASMIHSIAGTLKNGALLKQRPFRSPHHSASMPALVGGGIKAKPGEISLAHAGILFLDELPEFQRISLEALRQPLESNEIHIARANLHVTYPANIQLIAAMNPCRCGFADIEAKACSKKPKCMEDYQSKISGPLLDRIDIRVHMNLIDLNAFRDKAEAEDSASVRERILIARKTQQDRFDSLDVENILNANLSQKEVEKICTLTHDIESFFFNASIKLNLSARSLFRTLKVARTIADLDQKESIELSHLKEALSFKI